jgi:hypothetical protein
MNNWKCYVFYCDEVMDFVGFACNLPQTCEVLPISCKTCSYDNKYLWYILAHKGRSVYSQFISCLLLLLSPFTAPPLKEGTAY